MGIPDQSEHTGPNDVLHILILIIQPGHSAVPPQGEGQAVLFFTDDTQLLVSLASLVASEKRFIHGSHFGPRIVPIFCHPGSAFHKYTIGSIGHVAPVISHVPGALSPAEYNRGYSHPYWFMKPYTVLAAPP